MTTRCPKPGRRQLFSALTERLGLGSGTSRRRNIVCLCHRLSANAPLVVCGSCKIVPACSLKTGSTSIKDPSQAIFENGNPLPTGFSIAYDDEGDVFFIE
jgi:hypothetical protein